MALVTLVADRLAGIRTLHHRSSFFAGGTLLVCGGIVTTTVGTDERTNLIVKMYIFTFLRNRTNAFHAIASL